MTLFSQTVKRILLAGLAVVTIASCDNGTDPSVVADTTEPGDTLRQEDVTLRPADGMPEAGLDLIAPDGALEILAPAETTDFGGSEAGIEVVGPECEPGEGCLGDKCVENSDCLSGYCVEHLGEDICTIDCVEECPEGFECLKIGGAEPDVVFACLSKWPRLCLPCISNQDCKSGDVLGTLCVQPGEAAEFFCGTSCSGTDQCPVDYVCAEVTTIDGMYATQCVPEDGICECTDKAIDSGLHTVCEETNEFGTCQGFRMCEEEGLAKCDAEVPGEDVCDGLDNDCDGETDEDTCDDDNPCTEDVCDGAGGCGYSPLDNLECTDGNLCTTGDHCDNGVCVGNPIVCDDGNQCTDDYCDETGKCVADPNHELCDDGNPCTLGDVCDQAACIGTPISCDCQQDADCVALDDDDLCNGILYCDKTGLPYKCKVDPVTVPDCQLPPDTDPFCQQAKCTPETGDCSVASANEGFACNDSDACTIAEKCVEGTCGDGTPLPCNDGNPCTIDSCKADTGCVFIDSQGSCDDGNPCTVGDACEDGQCVPGEVLFCDDSNPCTADSCQPQSGCVYEPLEAQCDDGNPCTTDDHCQNGMCIAGALTVCTDGNQCTSDTCQPGLGCVHTMNADPCDDDNVCTTGDTCTNGACLGSGGLECNDNNSCTDDTCDAMTGCQFTPNNDQCSDGNLCTIDDQCVNGACTAGGFEDCSDGNLCTDDLCVPESGCSNPPNQLLCDDDNPCTALDQCTLGACQGTPFVCDDQVDCTDNICDGKGGCFHPVANGHCYIAGQCAEAGQVNPDNQCQACLPETAKNNWSPQDGGICAVVENGDATCLDGKCQLTDCDDGHLDCDEKLETGCETDILGDNDNCGECNKACVPPETCNNGECGFECPGGQTNCDGDCFDTTADPLNCGICGKECLASSPDKLGVCVNSQCGEILCPENEVNLNLESGDGCEYECAKTNGGEEKCDGFDNDCDGDTDEDFALEIDPDNCGQCGKVCGPYQHVDEAECENSKCGIKKCQEGYNDVDGVVLNGCEELVATGEIWVDAWNFFDPLEDGTKAHPFDTLAEAIAVAEDGWLVHVLEGTYAGNITIAIPNLVLEGSASDEVFVLGPQYGTGIKVTADGVKVKSMTIQGAANGVEFSGVANGTLDDAVVVAIAGKTEQYGVGVLILNSSNVEVKDSLIHNVTGGVGKTNCYGGGTGTMGAGVLVQSSQGAKITDNDIHSIKGGKGGKGSCNCYKGGVGGIGAAVAVTSNSNNTALSGNVFYDVIGGRGGDGQCSQKNGGGIGAGVYQNTGGGLVLENNVIHDIKGGLTTDNKPSAYSACLYGYKVGATLITGLTCVGSEVANQRGIWADASPQALFGISSSIIANVTGHCLFSHANNFPSTLMASYSAIFGCEKGEVSNAQLAGNCIKVDPLFTDLENDDFHLTAESPCIDAGKTSAEYCLEPQPNGCRVNMGAYGNTAAAMSAAGAEHCPCP